MAKIIINEKQFCQLLNEAKIMDLKISIPSIKEKRYAVSPQKVLAVKRFLDRGFKRGFMEDKDENGYPCTILCFGQMDNSGNSLADITPEDMGELLFDRFQNLCSTDDETRRLLKRIEQDWFNRKINDNGSLSVNFV